LILAWPDAGRGRRGLRGRRTMEGALGAVIVNRQEFRLAPRPRPGRRPLGGAGRLPRGGLPRPPRPRPLRRRAPQNRDAVQARKAPKAELRQAGMRADRSCPSAAPRAPRTIQNHGPCLQRGPMAHGENVAYPSISLPRGRFTPKSTFPALRAESINPDQRKRFLGRPEPPQMSPGSYDALRGRGPHHASHPPQKSPTQSTTQTPPSQRRFRPTQYFMHAHSRDFRRRRGVDKGDGPAAAEGGGSPRHRLKSLVGRRGRNFESQHSGDRLPGRSRWPRGVLEGMPDERFQSRRSPGGRTGLVHD